MSIMLHHISHKTYFDGHSSGNNLVHQSHWHQVLEEINESFIWATDHLYWVGIRYMY